MGMSEWNLREIEDINWDIFAKPSDHLVPPAGGELFDESSSLSYNCKKPRNEVNSSRVKNDYNRYSTAKPGNEDTCYYPPIQHTGSSSSSAPSQSDPKRSISGKIMDVRSSSNTDPNNIFLESTHKSNNTQFDWPDLSSFEDIDKLFGNWDSTLGQGQRATADELQWFSSSNTIYDPEIAFKTGYQSSGSNLVASHNLYESSTLNSDVRENVPSISDLDKPSSSTYAPWSGTDDLTKAKFTFKEKPYDGGETNNAELTKMQNDPSLIHGGLPYVKLESPQSSKGKRTGDSADPIQLNSNVPASNTYSPENTSQQMQFVGSSSYIPTLNPHPEPVFGVPVHQVPYTLSSNVDLKAGISSSSFYKMSDDMTQQLYVPQCIVSNENTQNQSGVKKGPVEVGNNTQMEDADTTEKVASFIQLHNAMHQLDVSTKICIRDSLYRLARNANQRHSFATQNYSEGAMDQNRNQGFKRSKRSAEYMDSETTTNPIDRSIAHLLFHRPHEVPMKSGGCATQFKSHIMSGPAYSLP